MALADNLDDFITAEIDQQMRGVSDGAAFVVDSPDKADWALRKIAKYRAQLAADEQLADSRRDQIDTWLSRQRDDATNSIGFFESLLRDYHQRRLDSDPRAKTIHLPAGELQARKRPDRWDIDPDAFIPWAQANRPELVRTKIEVDRNATKKLLAAGDPGTSGLGPDEHPAIDPDTGEIAAGVRIIDGDIGFTATTTEPLS